MTVSERASLEDKFKGCLLGGAIGDALGFTTENLSRTRIKAKFGRLTDYYVRPQAAYYTDDTQLTIALAETLIENDGFDLTAFRRRLARWWLVPPRLSGRSTKNAGLKCALGLKETGRHVPGSSGAMRTAPIALFYYDDEATLFDKTVEACLVTHTHPAAIAGALVSTFSIAYCLNHPMFDQTAYLTKISEVAGEFDAEMSQRLQSLPDMLTWPEEQVLQELLKNSKVYGSPIGDIITVAIYAFLKTPDDYEQTILFCINAGWDTDTMAAISGNIAGAWSGLTGIPAHWVANLQNKYKGRDYLLALAQSLHTGQNRLPKKNSVIDYLADFKYNLGFMVAMFTQKPWV